MALYVIFDFRIAIFALVTLILNYTIYCKFCVRFREIKLYLFLQSDIPTTSYAYLVLLLSLRIEGLFIL